MVYISEEERRKFFLEIMNDIKKKRDGIKRYEKQIKRKRIL